MGWIFTNWIAPALLGAPDTHGFKYSVFLIRVYPAFSVANFNF